MKSTISSRNPAALPDIGELKRRCQSLAMLDALLAPDAQDRYYMFYAKWNARQMLATMSNQSGDEYFIVFDAEAGAVIKGFAHESHLARYAVDAGTLWPGVLDQTPDPFREILAEPAFRIEDTTFCLWRAKTDAGWVRGDIAFPAGGDPDGSEDLLTILDGDPVTYKAWAEAYYEQDVPLGLVRHVYSHRPLNDKLLNDFNIPLSYEEILADVLEIGYPPTS